MTFQEDAKAIRWRLHCLSAPHKVHEMIATDVGRARFWAESAVERDGAIDFEFANGERFRADILENDPPGRFVIRYFGGSTVTFELEEDGRGGTDLSMTEIGCPEEERIEQIAGWVSLLLCLKSAVDFAVDLRNHDPDRTWDRGFANA